MKRKLVAVKWFTDNKDLYLIHFDVINDYLILAQEKKDEYLKGPGVVRTNFPLILFKIPYADLLAYFRNRYGIEPYRSKFLDNIIYITGFSSE
jgi:hypothetical protein